MTKETRVGYATIDALATIQDNYMRAYYHLTGKVDIEDMIKYDMMKMYLSDRG